jgi:hypothetical protein
MQQVVVENHGEPGQGAHGISRQRVDEFNRRSFIREGVRRSGLANRENPAPAPSRSCRWDE